MKAQDAALLNQIQRRADQLIYVDNQAPWYIVHKIYPKLDKIQRKGEKYPRIYFHQIIVLDNHFRCEKLKG